eukprot:scaffold4223_cov189-Amphora_coffeaeformis.AAC.4
MLIKSIIVALFLFSGNDVMAKKIDNKKRAKEALEAGVTSFVIGCDKFSGEEITEEETAAINELGAKLQDGKFAEVMGEARRQLRAEGRQLQILPFCCRGAPYLCWICCPGCVGTTRKLEEGDVVSHSETASMKKMLKEAGVKLSKEEKKFASQFECSLYWNS